MATLSDYVGSGFCEMTIDTGSRRDYDPLISRFDEFDMGGLQARVHLVESLFRLKIGHGRDYDDVTPLRGVYYGESDHHLSAEVTMSTSSIVSEKVPDVPLADQQQQ